MMLHARALKVTIVLDPGEVASLPKPRDGVARVELRVAVAGREVTADLKAKSLRKVLSTISESGADRVAVILQGKPGPGDRLEDGGIVAQLKIERAVA
jgi:hypothetical protein